MNCETIIICAVAANGGIGLNGDLAFHISADLKRFKAITTGHTVVMGRKTFESLPKGALPDRRNIVVTRNPEKFSEWQALHSATLRPAEAASSLEEAFAMAKSAGETKLFIIGGGTIYKAALPMTDRLEITEIAADAEDADTFFPSIPAEEWEVAAAGEWQRDEKSGVDFRFVSRQRI